MRRVNIVRRCLLKLLPFIILLCSNSLGYADWNVLGLPQIDSSVWDLASVHFSSSNDGWFAGTKGVNGTEKGLILHYSNGVLTPVEPNVNGRYELLKVYMTSDNDGWVIGNFIDTGEMLILHYQNGSWAPIYPPYSSQGVRYLLDIHFTSPTEGWAVGGDEYAGLLLHYLNGSWKVVSPPNVSPSWYLKAVHFTSANEGWAVGVDGGDNGTQGVLLHCLNGKWTSVNPPYISSYWELNSVHFPTPNEGWAVGYDSSRKIGVMLHYLNGSWAPIYPSLVGPFKWWWQLNSVYFTSPNEGWTVGEGWDDKHRGVLIHYSNGQWTEVLLDLNLYSWSLTGIYFPSPNEGWAVGEVQDYPAPPPNQRGLILKYYYPEIVSIPQVPSGPIDGTAVTQYGFSTGGSSSNIGDSIEYRFDWGDGANSSWSSSTSASHSWTSPGTYAVKAQARCAIHTSIFSEWSQPFQVAITPVGPDLSGSWTTSLTQVCRTVGKNQRCSLKGTFTVSNIGNRDASSTSVNFYLSANSTYEDGDTQLKSVATGKLKPGKSKAINVNITLTTNQTATGKYIIAVIDKDNLVPETDTTNNQIPYGPIP